MCLGVPMKCLSEPKWSRKVPKWHRWSRMCLSGLKSVLEYAEVCHPKGAPKWAILKKE